MKNTVKRDTRKGFIFQQCMRVASRVRQPRGRHHNASAPFPVMPGRGRLSHALVAVLSLALLLFSLIGMLAAITGTHALIANRLSVSSAAARPRKTPPSRHSPTPTTVPSPTFTAPPTTIATVPTSATPPVKATTPLVGRQPGGSRRRRSLSTLPTSTTSNPALQHPFRVQQQGEEAFSPLVRGILSGIAAVGLWLLRKWLLSVRKVEVASQWRYFLAACASY